MSLPQAEVVFQVSLLQALPSNSTLNLEILDDITGLAFNPQRIEMSEKDDHTYFIKIPLVIGSVVKYRYVRKSDVSTVEYSPQGTQVRFRMADITGPAIIQDSITGWIGQLYSGPLGKAQGQFIDDASNAPIPNLLVTAEGIQTVTASDGTFFLEGLTPGTHDLVAYSLDGRFITFTQGITIADKATTPVFVHLNKRKLVNLTFNITAPDSFSQQLPVRFASNLQSLGNVYADLLSGSTTIAANLPTLVKISTGHYQLKMQLPVGFDLRYKYSLGDGLWNGELDSAGAFRLREIIVPNQDITINDVITTFQSPSLGAISFLVTTTAPLPAGESVSIQFNPFGWFESIPMVKIGENQWLYTLYSPLALFGQIEYRFCRNDLCDLTQAVAQKQQIFAASSQPKTISETISEWTNYSSKTSPTEAVTDGDNISPRPDFTAGFEITSQYNPIEPAYIASCFSKIASTGANYVVFSPTWTATRNNPPLLEPVPGTDISWTEMQTTIIQAQQYELNAALFPRLNFPNGASNFWSSANRDTDWWTNWYSSYHRYMMQVADWAQLTKIKTIIIGDPMVNPSMSGGLLSDGKSANAPENADDQWRQMVKDIRSHFSGVILGAIAYPSTSPLPGWLDSVDGIYVLYSDPLSQSSQTSVADLEITLTKDLNQNLSPEIKSFNKPVWLALNYPSASNAFSGCTDTLGSCLDDWGNGKTDLDAQARIYNAAIIVAGKESWISGFISRDNQPIAAVMDSSPSVLSKPANDILWFWYHFLLNKTS